MTVHLISINCTTNPQWSLGNVYCTSSAVNAICSSVDTLVQNTDAQALMFWDCSMGNLDENVLTSLLKRRVDVWHAGLWLGMNRLPEILKFSQPASFFNRDPDPDIEASSWRLALNACLIKTNVIRELGFLDQCFETLTAASLELGYRYLNSGVIIRHTPALVPGFALSEARIPLRDEFLFTHLTQGRRMKYWTLFRTLFAQYAPLPKIARDARRAFSHPRTKYQAYSSNQVDLKDVQLDAGDYRVSVLIPTVDRYPYLRVVLDQLRAQTVRPTEVIIVDQTDGPLRDTTIPQNYSDLPITLIYQDEAGQCSSRNAGLMIAHGDHILLLDDDVEMDEKLIENHLKVLWFFGADVSSGAVVELDGQCKADDFIQLSGVFPAGNSMLRRTTLEASGLFDLAYDKGQTADGDLGMRIHLSGALMIYNPQVSVLHHRAPRGGLRKHKARIITRSSSRSRLLHRRLPHATECYRMMRYFDDAQVREALWIAAAGTFSANGRAFRRILKAIVALGLLPNTICLLSQRYTEAKQMLGKYPQIPKLSTQTSEEMLDVDH